MSLARHARLKPGGSTVYWEVETRVKSWREDFPRSRSVYVQNADSADAEKATDTAAFAVRDTIDLDLQEGTSAALASLAGAVRARGGRAVLVGGAVRDAVARAQGRKVGQAADVDVEVFGLPHGELQALLGTLGRVDATGAAFEVFKLSLEKGSAPIDVSLPRKETQTGEGHRGFTVESDPAMTFAEAARRRDFTIGAMGIDLTTGELLDPWGGAKDLESGTLRHVSPAFGEDPLRVLRAARFCARLSLALHEDTSVECRNLRPQASTLPVERLWGELSGILLQADTPGHGLRVLDQVGWIDVFSEIADLREVQQDPEWHPEGDVFTHTCHVLDYWASNARSGNMEDDLTVGVAAMCHDLGKASTTVWKDGTWKAHGHEAAGVGPTEALLTRMGQVRLAQRVLPLVENHLAPLALHAGDRTDRSVRRLAARVPRLDLLSLVAVADAGGRPPLDPQRGHDAREWLMSTSTRLGLGSARPERIARGEHLMELGMKPGPAYGELLDAAYEAQLDGLVTDERSAREFLAERAQQASRKQTLPLRSKETPNDQRLYRGRGD